MTAMMKDIRGTKNISLSLLSSGLFRSTHPLQEEIKSQTWCLINPFSLGLREQTYLGLQTVARQ